MLLKALKSIFIVMTCANATARGALFVGMGDLPGGPVASTAMGVSGDGTVVVGGASRGVFSECCGRERVSFESVRWTFEHGLQALGTLPDEYTGLARATSHDGSVTVGGSNAMGTLEPPSQGFRWTRGAGIEPIGESISGSCLGNRVDDVSGDGSIAVGRSFSGGVGGYGCVTQAIAVLEDNRMIRLGIQDTSNRSLYRGYNESEGRAVSSDGSKILGNSNRRPSGSTRSWIWHEDTGIRDIGSVEGFTWIQGIDISPNGKLVIGATSPNSDFEGLEGFIWSEDEEMRLIPIRYPIAVSDDGLVIGLDDVDDNDYRLSIWSDDAGVRRLEDVLTEDWGAGNQIEGWDINNLGSGFVSYSISEDGTVLTGTSVNPQGDTEGWIAILRESNIDGDFNENGTLDAADIGLLTVQIRQGTRNPVFDLNGDADIDDLDRAMWISEIRRTYLGDANLDGEFTSDDIVAVFEAGEYEDAIAMNSSWATGDWNGDGEFTNEDLVSAFIDGGYNLGPRPAPAAVPEPTSLWCLVLSITVFGRTRRIPEADRDVSH